MVDELPGRAGKLFAYADVGECSCPLVWRERNGVEGGSVHISCDFNVSLDEHSVEPER